MTAMNSLERKAIGALAGIFALRMLGLFMILPVFAIYANQLNHVTPSLVGVALGVYGLTQALLQIPFGFASDRFGRKPMIILGLLLFCFGSMAAALSDSIYGVILGRSLQGASAIGCVIMALAADLTRDAVRVRAMAMIGITIGLSFALAMVLGPILSEWYGVTGIFWLTAGLAGVAILLLLIWVPTPRTIKFNQEVSPHLSLIPRIFKQPELNSLTLGVFVLHASLVALFLKIPLYIQALGFVTGQSWRFYVPVLLGSLLAAIPALSIMERKDRVKSGLTLAWITLAIAEWGIGIFLDSTLGFAFSVGLFFTAFNILEASLPSLVSRIAPTGTRGTALGLYSSAQFLGLFLGGVIGGWLDASYGMVGILLFCIILAVIWLIVDFIVNFKRGLPWQEG